MWQGKISVCKVLVPARIVLVKNDYYYNDDYFLSKI